MGNVHASESGVPPSPPPGSPGEEKDKNPGTVEDLHRECKELFPMAFEGGKLIVQKALSNNFQVQIYWINLNVHARTYSLDKHRTLSSMMNSVMKL